MKKIILLFLLAFSFIAFAQEREKFDPGRDAAKDIKTAINAAKKQNKHILLDVGGEWCIWCHRLDQFYIDNKDAGEILEKNFIVVKINFSPENENKKVLSQYPKIDGYPHYFVLDGNGKFLHSQNTGDLEEGKGYDKEKIISFLKKWGPKKS